MRRTPRSGEIFPKEPIESLIFNLRGQKVILDADLAELYDVPTKRLNEQIRRNVDRFPDDFSFQLTRKEADEIQRSRSQFATLKRGQNIKYLPRLHRTRCDHGRKRFEQS